MNVIQLRQDPTSDNAIINLVEAARAKFAAEFSGSDQGFDSMIWNVKFKADRTTSSTLRWTLTWVTPVDNFA